MCTVVPSVHTYIHVQYYLALPVESERENLECVVVCMLIPFPLCVDVSAAWIVSTGKNCNSSALRFRSLFQTKERRCEAKYMYVRPCGTFDGAK
jgi:hypothetical protein